jgi:hypothetical protein
MSWLGNRAAASTVVFNFTTTSFGTPTTLSGTPAISIYKNSVTQSTTGITLTVDYDSVTGLNHVVIDTSADGTFYATGNDFSIVITTGTVGGVSVVGYVVGEFTIPGTSGAVSAGVNVAYINSVACTSVTTVSAYQGTTQPINFTGTGASALVKSDMVDIAGAAVSTSSAQIGTNVVSYASGQAPLQPTVAGRTLDVTATGGAGIDWGNVENQTTVVGLTNTTISGGSIPSVAGIATAVWQDTTAGDFTVASSIGKSLYTSGVVPGASGGITIAGSNAATTLASLTITGAMTINGANNVAQTGDTYNALISTSYAEPGQGAPPATATFLQKLGYLYKAWRNKSDQTSSLYQLYADNTTTVDQKATVSDDGTTFTREEVASGP